MKKYIILLNSSLFTEKTRKDIQEFFGKHSLCILADIDEYMYIKELPE